MTKPPRSTKRPLAGTAAVLLCLSLVPLCGCPFQIIQDVADDISGFVNQPLNEFLPTEVIGLQLRNESDGKVVIDLQLDQAQGLTNRGPVVVGQAAFSGIELPAGQTIGELTGRLSSSDLQVSGGVGLYPCVRGRVCVRVSFDGQTSVERCVELDQDFQCGQALIFTVRPDRSLVFAAEPIDAVTPAD